jgi:hypothetical protein
MEPKNQGSHNAPSKEAQMKGGQQSHQGGSTGSAGKAGMQNQPSHEASVKGGEHSHSGSGNKK